MSNLVVFDFNRIHTTDEVLNKLCSLEKHLIDLEDACVVERDEGGKVHIKQAVSGVWRGDWWDEGRPVFHKATKSGLASLGC